MAGLTPFFSYSFPCYAVPMPKMTVREIYEANMRLPDGAPERRTWEWARWRFEYWAQRTVVGACRDWDGLSWDEKSIWHDMTVLEQSRLESAAAGGPGA